MSAPAPRYLLVRRPGLGLDEFSRRCGLHPEMVRRLVALGLLDGDGLRFDASAVAVVARIQRLRSGLGLNYAAIGLVLDLLDRIEADPRRRTSRWTPAP